MIYNLTHNLYSFFLLMHMNLELYVSSLPSTIETDPCIFVTLISF